MNTSHHKSNIKPQGKYLIATRFGNLVFSSGITPRINGQLIEKGKIDSSKPNIYYKKAITQTVKNALIAIENELNENETIIKIISFTIFLNTDEKFQKHSEIADLASNYLFSELGNIGIGSRAALGVSSLPGNSLVEIQLIAGIS